MHAFSALIDGLIYTRSRDQKVRLIADYLRDTPDPDRGWALAALAGTLSIATVKSAAIRNMAEERFDPMLFRMSRDYVGDTAETVALMWPDVHADAAAPTVSEVIDLLNSASRARAPTQPQPLERAAFPDLSASAPAGRLRAAFFCSNERTS